MLHEFMKNKNVKTKHKTSKRFFGGLYISLPENVARSLLNAYTVENLEYFWCTL